MIFVILVFAVIAFEFVQDCVKGLSFPFDDLFLEDTGVEGFVVLIGGVINDYHRRI
jgi:hypothetical protein